MKYIPETEEALVLRTDFSNEALWESICVAIQEPEPVQGFKAYVSFVSDSDFNGINADQIFSFIPPGFKHRYAFIVDQIALTHPDHPILVMDLNTEPGRTFRVIPTEMWGVENNLSLANMDFAEFANSTDPDGVFRGFPGS